MDKNQGYEIIQAVMLENGRGFALGHHPTAPSPYVTWACYDDKDGQSNAPTPETIRFQPGRADRS